MKGEFDVIVVGAGIVGLASAAALARAGRSLLVLERREAPARETSSRSSEVIHAGLYYPPGSLKAELCVEGRERIYERCARLRIPHRPTGKLIVATRPEEESRLDELAERGRTNGAPGLRRLGAEEAQRLEPALRVRSALLSPRTGIVDSHALADSFAAEAEAHGARILCRQEVVAIEPCPGGYRVTARGADGEHASASAAAVVNAAGLASDAVAALAGLDVDRLGYRIHLCKGDYFSLAPGASLRVQRLVYPLHDAAGLGVHVCLDLAGRVRFGPDTEYVDEARYDVDPGKAEAFAAALRRFLPGLRPEWLAPDTAGLRPKLAAAGEGFRDFVVAEESAQGLPGFVDLVGIESPGLTAAPAIAERVRALLG